MRRRKFGLLGASSVAALAVGAGGPRAARAAVSVEQAAQLKTTLTPFGAERAGNADGSIPAWDGGVTTPPAGWTPDQAMPDIYADDKIILTINAGNMAQYKDRLSDGVMAMMEKYGFSINVYPTHRPASAPQWVYDNTYQNAVNAQPDPRGIRFGFSGAYGGIPFPIPSTDENQGGEIIWNHLCRWNGVSITSGVSTFVVVDGQPALASSFTVSQNNEYYTPGGNLENYNGVLFKLRASYTAPPVLDGQQIIQLEATQPLKTPNVIWQLLPGQGRVRQAPELSYDTPAVPSDGICNYDEFFGFFESPDRYNWHLVTKKEMYIPYNNNGLLLHEPSEILMPHFVNPDFMRWELHRVWVVDAILAPDSRNVIPHRRMYIDEDNWLIGLVDSWDAQGDIWRVSVITNWLRPDVPGLMYGGATIYNLQSNAYVINNLDFADPKYGQPYKMNNIPEQTFSSTALAAQAQY